MRALYLYGIVRAGDELPPGLRGVAGETVQLLKEGLLGAVVSDLPDVAYEARREDLVAHSDVLQAVVASAGVLPMGFGTVFGSPAELSDTFLRPNEDALVRMLDAMDGLVEIQVRAEYDADLVARDIATSDRSVRKLQARVRSRGDVESKIELGRHFAGVLDRRRYADGSALVDRLGAVARASSVGDTPGEYGVLRASFLVARNDLARFDEEAEEAVASLGGHVAIRCVGPLPPYSFVDASALAVG